MRDHVRTLAILNILFGALGLLLATIMALMFGGVLGVVRSETGAASEALVTQPAAGAVGRIIVFLIALISVPAVATGVSLLKKQPWARPLTVLLAAFHVLSVPAGTALGMYALWMLLHR